MLLIIYLHCNVKLLKFSCLWNGNQIIMSKHAPFFAFCNLVLYILLICYCQFSSLVDESFQKFVRAGNVCFVKCFLQVGISLKN